MKPEKILLPLLLLLCVVLAWRSHSDAEDHARELETVKSAAYDDGYAAGYIARLREEEEALKALPTPDHGHIFEQLTFEGQAPFSVTGDGDIYLVLDPIDLSDNVTNGLGQQQVLLNEKYMELRVFLRSGKIFETDVPLGEYEVYYATGDIWYGEEELFGPNTQYYKCDGTFDFTEDSQGYNGWTLTLSAVYNGNLDTDLVDESDFPK